MTQPLPAAHPEPPDNHAVVAGMLAYFDALDPAERQAAEAHLAQCAECRALLAAYEAQNASLAAIVEIRPRRDLHPRARARSASGPRVAFAQLGSLLALGGLGALLWLFTLQLRQFALQGGSPASPAIEPGLALPPTTVQPPSPWLPALPWIGAALLITGGLFILSRRSWIPTLLAGLVSAFLLISFVPPLSALPNPLGIYWRLAGGYAYDPRLPFKNDFVLAGRPESQLRPFLDQLIGEVGLSPLDPTQPLARYEILSVSLHSTHKRTALVSTRFIYADGSSRVYPVPLLGPTVDVAGFWLAGWRADGLQRLRSEHLALFGQPFATDAAPIRLGSARRLDLARAASRLDEANPGHWLWESVRVQRLVWAPNQSAFLMVVESDPGSRQLWRVPVSGEEPLLVAAGDIREYGWSPDSANIVYSRLDPEAAAVDSTRPYAIVVASTEARSAALPLAAGLASDKLPGLTGQGAWFFSDGALWLAPYAGPPARLMLAAQVLAGPLSEAGGAAPAARPAPDGALVAFNCGGSLCLAAVGDDPGGGGIQRIPSVSAAEMAWSPDGARLAVVDRDPNGLRPVRLVIFSRSGDELLSRVIAPFDVTEAPEWTPGGEAVLVQTYPQSGRRIIAVHISSGEVLDLSREHWDAYFALAPDGRSLLLNNGRGDFWLADLGYQP